MGVVACRLRILGQDPTICPRNFWAVSVATQASRHPVIQAVATVPAYESHTFPWYLTFDQCFSFFFRQVLSFFSVEDGTNTLETQNIIFQNYLTGVPDVIMEMWSLNYANLWQAVAICSYNHPRS